MTTFSFSFLSFSDLRSFRCFLTAFNSQYLILSGMRPRTSKLKQEIFGLYLYLTIGGSEEALPSDKTSSSIGDLFFLKRSLTLTGDSGLPAGSGVSDDICDQLDLVFLGEISCTGKGVLFLILMK